MLRRIFYTLLGMALMFLIMSSWLYYHPIEIKPVIERPTTFNFKTGYVTVYPGGAWDMREE